MMWVVTVGAGVLATAPEPGAMALGIGLTALSAKAMDMQSRKRSVSQSNHTYPLLHSPANALKEQTPTSTKQTNASSNPAVSTP